MMVNQKKNCNTEQMSPVKVSEAILHVEKLIQFVQQDNDDFCIDDQLFNNLIKLKKSLLEEAL